MFITYSQNTTIREKGTLESAQTHTQTPEPCLSLFPLANVPFYETKTIIAIKQPTQPDNKCGHKWWFEPIW